ncbi:MAG: carboxypeptidase regulatory-like domain-containing protein [Planctomycetes bacterium]|nr:carboxypeptidase regulatory-like domain-containing protein [Planctomycetota bacterium]
MITRQFTVRSIIIILALLIPGKYVQASGSITGQGRYEKIAGVPSMGYKYLYEWDLFLSPSDNSMVGPFRRLGAPPGQTPTGDGYYQIGNLPAGTYSVYVNQPDFFASPKMVPNVQIVDGQQTVVNVDLDVDYSTYFKDTGGEQWTPWEWEWFQTFLATGTSVRGISWMMAGWNLYNGKYADISILEDNGEGDVRNWTLLGTKRENNIASDSDEWVRWPSGQILLTPGKQYAVKIWVLDGCAVYKRDKDGSSYPNGRAYDINGNPQTFDLNVTVFVDRNNQSVTHTRLNPGPGNFDGGLSDTRWGQTFVATGTSLLAADLFAASADGNFDLTWKIRQGGPNGAQIGPTKTTQGAYFASSTDLVGVSYNPNDVTLVPGQTYCIEVTDTMNFTPYTQGNSYSDGTAYRNGTATGNDLAMTIMEYASPQQPRDADTDDDGKVTFTDYCTLANGESPADIFPPPFGDGSVDSKDLGLFIQKWLTATTIPPLPGQASNLYPLHGAANVSTTADLSWIPGPDAISHDVYFGTSSPGTFQGNQTAAIFDPGTMSPSTMYYWRIDSVNGWGKTEGQVWFFSTMVPPPF